MQGRRSIEIPNFRHADNPIPAASRIGNIVVSGAIFGLDLENGKMPEGLESQCANAFGIMGKLLAAADADYEQVIKVNVFLRSGQKRSIINDEWIKYFPEKTSRPARHVVINDAMPESQLIQLDFIAVIM